METGISKPWLLVRKECLSESSEESLYCFEYDGTVCTSFLVPDQHVTALSVWKGQRYYFSARIRNLLEESAHLIYYGLISQRRTKVTRSYQKTGLSLRKVSGRVESQDLVEMDMMAQALQVSRSRLLVLLLEWEQLGWLGLIRELGLARGTTSYTRKLISTQTLDKTTHPDPARHIIKVALYFDS